MDIIGMSLGEILLITGSRISSGKSFLMLLMYCCASCIVLFRLVPYFRFTITTDALGMDLVSI